MSAASSPSTLLSLPSATSKSSAWPGVVAPGKLISQPATIGAVLACDFAMLVLSGIATWAGLQVGLQGIGWFMPLQLAMVVAVTLVTLKLRWAYTIPALRNPVRQTSDLLVALLFALGCLIVSGVLADQDMPALRTWAFAWLLAALAAGAASRLLIGHVISAWTREGRLSRRAVIVGGGKPTYDLIRRLDRPGNSPIQILGIFDDRDNNRSPEMVDRYCKLGRFDDLVDFCREQRVDLLIIALPATAEDRILHILKKLWVLPIDVRIAALGAKLKLRSRAYNFIGDVPFLPVFDKPMSDWNVALKAMEDRVLSALGLLLLSPVLALIALAVKLDSKGPVLFRQNRHGLNNQSISVYKFRSMYVDQCDFAAARQVTRGDPRVTRVGAFLRRTSLDELPQLFNVLRGELSLVGPRPHALQAKAGGRVYDEVVEGYFARHKVKPGITGWAQVSGWRGETDTVEKIEQRVAHDLFYIENWSAWFDLRILLMTPVSLVTGRNAY